jgi:hypothetical protein
MLDVDLRGARRPMAWLAAGVLVGLAGVQPTQAGRWISGGMLDEARGGGVNFSRFLAAEDEGQMTVRCDELDGVWIDAGVQGNAELPEGVEQGDEIEASFAFVGGAEAQTVTASGPVMVRGDGAVLVSLSGDQAAELGRQLLVPSDRVEVSIAGDTRTVTLAGALEKLQTLASRCTAWPR